MTALACDRGRLPAQETASNVTEGDGTHATAVVTELQRPERQSPPAANRGAKTVTTSDSHTVLRRADAFLHDALLEVFLEGERKWWLRRSEAFLAARPQPGDFHGAATREQLSAQWRRLTDMAEACRARAHVSLVADVREDVANVLSEVA